MKSFLWYNLPLLVAFGIGASGWLARHLRAVPKSDDDVTDTDD